MSYHSTSAKRLLKELAEAKAKTPAGLRIVPTKNLFIWDTYIDGPADSPYAGGVFHFHFKFPVDYPFAAPKVKCMTRVYHCNINTIGDICLDLLKDKWTPLLTTTSILLSLQQLLVEPNPLDPLMGSIAEKYKEKRAEHDKMAKLFTRKYATPSKNKSATQSKKSAKE